MSIYSLIRDLSQTLVVESTGLPPTFIQGWKQWENLIQDEVLGDIVFLDWPVRSRIGITFNNLSKTFIVEMFFCEKSELEYTPEQHEEILERQRIQSDKFFVKLKDSEGTFLESVENITTIDVINFMNRNNTGIAARFEVKLVPTYVC